MSPPSGLSVDCDNFQTASSMQVVLSYPNIATVAGRPRATGPLLPRSVDVWLNGSISFAFSAWDPTTKASVCDKSIPGSMISLDGSQWRCFQMTKVAGEKLKHPVQDAKPLVRNNISPEERAIRAEKRAAQLLADPLRKSRTFHTDHKFLAKVNAAQSLFTVKHYPEYDGMSIGELERMRGLVVEDGDVAPLEEIAPSNSLHAPRLAAKDVPASFDWRNVSGVNFVSPVRSQGSCGSCYAFASAGMMEARIRVRSNNKEQPILSPQDVVSCSNYAQGCEGGFAYLVSVNTRTCTRTPVTPRAQPRLVVCTLRRWTLLALPALAPSRVSCSVPGFSLLSLCFLHLHCFPPFLFPFFLRPFFCPLTDRRQIRPRLRYGQ